MILFKKKIIFVHPPKTGGTTIDHLLYKYEFEKKLEDINSNDHLENLIGGFINKYYNIYHLTDGLQHLSFYKIKEIYDCKVICVETNIEKKLKDFLNK